MSNNHLLFQLPQCFITLPSKQGACFSSILISFPKWLLQFLLDCPSAYSPSTPRTTLSLAALTSSCSLLPTHSNKAYPNNQAKGQGLIAASTKVSHNSCMSQPALCSPFAMAVYLPRMTSHCFSAIWSLCLQFSKC